MHDATDMHGHKADFGQCSIINPIFIGFQESSSCWSIQLFFFLFYFPLVTI